MNSNTLGVSRFQSPSRAVGGHLTIGDDTLQFEPHFFDRWFHGHSLTLEKRQIKGVSVQPRNLPEGIWTPRLRIELSSGQTEVFLVKHPLEVASRLKNWARIKHIG